MKHYLIDSENVGDFWIPLLELPAESTELIVFYTKNSPHMSYDSLIKLKESDRTVTFIKCYEGTNALDFQLCSELGFRIASDKEDEFIIVTNDTGYDAAVKYWRHKEYSVKRIAGKDTRAGSRRRGSYVRTDVAAEVSSILNVQVQEPEDSSPENVQVQEPEDSSPENVQVQEPEDSFLLNVQEQWPEDSFLLNVQEREPEDSSPENAQVQWPEESAVCAAQEETGAGDTEAASADMPAETASADISAEEIPAADNAAGNDAAYEISAAENAPGAEGGRPDGTARRAADAGFTDAAAGRINREEKESVQELSELRFGAAGGTQEGTSSGQRAQLPDYEAGLPDSGSDAAEPDTAAAAGDVDPAPDKGRQPEEDRFVPDMEEITAIVNCIGMDNLAELHNQLIQFYGDHGKEAYQDIKNGTFHVEKENWSREEKFLYYSALIFRHSDEPEEAREEGNIREFADFLLGAEKKRQNLNSLRYALLKHYGKEKGRRYYFMLKPYVKALNQM